MSDSMFRELDNEEEQEFRQWARDNYTPGDDISKIWHPVVRDECSKINEEAGEETFPVDYELSENQKRFVRDARKQGLDIRWHYSGRGMYGEECPGVVVSGAGDFKTDADYNQDNMGLDLILYAQY